MISFDLICDGGHRFEGWFGHSADFAAQREQGLLACPLCGSHAVEKALSVPNVGAKGNQARPVPVPVTPSPSTPVAAPGGGQPVMQTPDPEKLHAFLTHMAEQQAAVLKDADYVGRRFGEEARAIHYGETEARRIYGETSAEEAQALAEEGVGLMPLPFPVVPPRAKN